MTIEKKIFLETPRKLMREIPWDPIRKTFLFISLLIFIGSIANTEIFHDATFEWTWWWFWFGFFLTLLPVIMGRIACGWFCPYAALHDIFFTKLKYRRLSWPEKLKRTRWLLLFTILGIVAVLEIFWEWDFFIWYCRMYLVLAILFGLIFKPRDWCRYLCILGAYAQLYSRIRVLGIRVDPELCRKCRDCPCHKNCLMEINWIGEIIGKEKWITPDYCILCLRCVNTCPFGAVYAWRVH